MPQAVNILGDRYHSLVAAEKAPGPGNRWLFLCDCGGSVIQKAALVRFGNTKSCGCLIKSILKERSTTHGKSSGATKHPLYDRWNGMKARCENPSHSGYKNYGAKGVVVCERWQSFEFFLEDMESSFAPGLTLERKDNSKGYDKENVVWATKSVQSRNTCRNSNVTINDETLTVRDWEIRKGVRRGCFQRRIDLGWGPELAVTLSVQPGKPLEKR